MKNNTYPATIIAFEGLDCSFKSTTAKAVYEKYKKEGKKVYFFKFPDYNCESSHMVRSYLEGKYNKVFNLNDKVKKWKTITIMYAMDRFDSFTEHNIWDILNDPEAIIIFDRYCTSNLFYQTSHLLKDAMNYIDNLYNEISEMRNLEYNILGLPIEDITIYMKAPLDKILEQLDIKVGKDEIENNKQLMTNTYYNALNVLSLISFDKMGNLKQDPDTIHIVNTVDINDEYLSETELVNIVINKINI